MFVGPDIIYVVQLIIYFNLVLLYLFVCVFCFDFNFKNYKII